MATIGTAFAKSVVKEQYKDRDPFWTPQKGTPEYSLLNKVSVPSTELIRQYQLKKIKSFESQAKRKLYKNLDGIAKTNFDNVVQSFESDENQALNKALENLFTRFNSFYYIDKSEEKSEQTWKTLTTRLRNLYVALEKVMNELNVPKKTILNEATILGQTLDNIEKCIKACNLQSLDAGIINNFLKDINNIKGGVLEELGVAYFRNLKIPNIASIRLGSVSLNTKRENRHSGQLIQDLIAYDITSPDILNDVIVEYRPAADGASYIQAPLSQLFKDIENANKAGKKQIVITDETYDVLTSLSSINIQAKSGKNQLPWNKNLSTSVAIEEYEKDNLSVSVKRTFSLLRSLNLGENSNQPWQVLDSHSSYNALANYGLATVLNKVMHLSREGNQYVLTPYGFMPFSKRVAQLMETEKSIALLQDQIMINNEVMTKKHRVGIE